MVEPTRAENFYRCVRGEVDVRLVVPWTAHMMQMISQPST
jgi:hypothetical protein